MLHKILQNIGMSFQNHLHIEQKVGCLQLIFIINKTSIAFIYCFINEHFLISL